MELEISKLYRFETDEDRLEIWQAFQKIENRIKNAKSIAQNPTLFDSDELDNFYSDINSISDSLLNIKHLINDKKTTEATWDDTVHDWSFDK